jgi:glycosyltransferase involved in cell wall biosynthesis
VRHEGSVSFSKDKDSYLAENLKTLYAIHPEYSGSVESFLRRDPLRLVRRRAGQILIREYISERFSSCVLFVCHDFGGGTLRAMDDLEARMADEGVAVVRLSEFSRAERDELVEYLKTLKLIFAHVHSGIATGPELAEVIEEIGIKTIYSIHDYAWYCPRITMIGETGTYCGDPGLDGCRSCMKAVGPSPAILNDPVDPSVDIVRWREAWRVRLLKADGIFAPSRDAAARISRWLGREVQFKPHWEKPARIQVARASSRDGEVNVCFIGAIGMHKGFRELREMAEIARVENPHVRFHVIGYTCADEQLKSYPNITIWGKYKKSELSAMLRECHGDVAAFFSPWPETFCYTLSEAVEAGLRPIAYDIGAFRERIPKIGGGRLVALGTPSNQLLGAILELANSSIPIPATDAIDYGSIMKDYYGIYSPSEAPCTGRNQ